MMKLSICLIIALFISTGLCADGVQPEGSGTQADPYQVEILDNLLWVSTNSSSWSSYFIQIADIDASDTQNWNNGEGFSPIGTDMYSPFIGTYNGLDHEIGGLYIDRYLLNYFYQGLFGYIYSATIENLGLTDIFIFGDHQIGGLVGYAKFSTINNCFCTGNVSGHYYTGSQVGGLAGTLYESNLDNSYSTCDVHGHSFVGGLVGENIYESLINRCFSTGTITTAFSGFFCGGLVGFNSNSSITNSYSTGNLVGEYGEDLYNGGLIGINFGQINNSFYNFETVLINGHHFITFGALDNEKYEEWINNELVLDINSYLDYNGESYLISSVDDFKSLLAFGQSPVYSFLLTTNLDLSAESNFYIPYFAGEFDGNNFCIDNFQINILPIYQFGLFSFTFEATIKNLGITNVDVNGTMNVASLIGFNYFSNIEKCYSTGNINGYWIIGGLVCNNIGSIITNCSSSCNINGITSIGGLVSVNRFSSSIANCYSTGTINGTDRIGGLVYLHYENSTINCCFSVCIINEEVPYEVGGLVGYNENSDNTNSFWDIEVSGQTISAGGTGKTTAEMLDVATYTDLSTVGLDMPWDFVGNPFDDTGNEDYWDIDGSINNGYPYLANPLTEIYDEEIIEITEVSKLISNYPNPFNPTTNISFSNVEESKIELSIFNIKGQKVKQLVSDQLASGEHSVVWDGRDENNHPVGSGIYFYKLEVNNKNIAIKKCLLLK